MKKILSLILVLAMTFSLSTTALAADSTTSSISENEAVELARWFIANDIYENGNNGWSESTVIDSVTTDSGFMEVVTSLTCPLMEKIMVISF